MTKLLLLFFVIAQMGIEFLCSGSGEEANWVPLHMPKWMREAVEAKNMTKLQDSCFNVNDHMCKPFFNRSVYS